MQICIPSFVKSRESQFIGANEPHDHGRPQGGGQNGHFPPLLGNSD